MGTLKDLQIHLLVWGEDGKDCIAIILDFIARFGFEHATDKVENMYVQGKSKMRGHHRKKKLCSAPLLRKLLQAAINPLLYSNLMKIFLVDLST